MREENYIIEEANDPQVLAQKVNLRVGEKYVVLGGPMVFTRYVESELLTQNSIAVGCSETVFAQALISI